LNPDEAPHVLVSELDSKIVGFYCDIFINLKIKDIIVRGRWGGNFVIAPQHRGKGIRLFKKSLDFPVYPLCGFPNQRAFLFEQRVGTTYIAKVYSLLRIINAYQFLNRFLKNRYISYLISIPFTLALRLLFTPKIPLNNPGIKFEEITYFDERFDKLWDEASKDYNIIVVRNSRYLNWRFTESPVTYKIFSASEDNRILGYIVLRFTEKFGVKVGQVVDIFCHSQDHRTICCLLDKAICLFEENKCALAECLILTDKKAYLKALSSRGFWFKKQKAYFNFYTPDKEQAAYLSNSKNWFITNSDPDLD
jgi:hypothetical protein